MSYEIYSKAKAFEMPDKTTFLVIEEHDNNVGYFGSRNWDRYLIVAKNKDELLNKLNRTVEKCIKSEKGTDEWNCVVQGKHVPYSKFNKWLIGKVNKAESIEESAKTESKYQNFSSNKCNKVVNFLIDNKDIDYQKALTTGIDDKETAIRLMNAFDCHFGDFKLADDLKNDKDFCLNVIENTQINKKDFFNGLNDTLRNDVDVVSAIAKSYTYWNIEKQDILKHTTVTENNIVDKMSKNKNEFIEAICNDKEIYTKLSPDNPMRNDNDVQVAVFDRLGIDLLPESASVFKNKEKIKELINRSSRLYMFLPKIARTQELRNYIISHNPNFMKDIADEIKNHNCREDLVDDLEEQKSYELTNELKATAPINNNKDTHKDKECR